MGQYDDRLVAAIKSGSHEDLKALEEPFARQAGLNPEHLAERKAATKAKYGRPLTTNDDDLLCKARATDDEPIIDEKDALSFVEALEGLAAIRREARTQRKTRT